MALVLADRVQETSTTSGTGNFTLNGAVSGYQSFATGIGSGNTVYYAIYDATAFAWETGLGTFTSPSTLTRTTVFANSLGTTAFVSFAGNTTSVFATYPGSKAVSIDTLATPPAIGGTTPAAGTFTTLIGNSTSQFGKTSENYIQAVGAATTVAPILSAQSSTDTNVDLTLTPKGAGRVNITTSIKPKVSSAASVTSPLAWNSTSFDEYAITALANALTINADANASPADGQKIMFRFKDNGTDRALTWTTGSTNSFRVVGVTLPTTTVASKIVYVGCIYNAADSRWDAVAVSQEA